MEAQLAQRGGLFVIVVGEVLDDALLDVVRSDEHVARDHRRGCERQLEGGEVGLLAEERADLELRRPGMVGERPHHKFAVSRVQPHPPRQQLESEANQAWAEARKASDFSLFAGKLTEIFELKKEVAAITLATGVRIHLRWVPSARNWADGPSRGHRIGYFDQKSKMVKTEAV